MSPLVDLKWNRPGKLCISTEAISISLEVSKVGGFFLDKLQVSDPTRRKTTTPSTIRTFTGPKVISLSLRFPEKFLKWNSSRPTPIGDQILSQQKKPTNSKKYGAEITT